MYVFLLNVMVMLISGGGLSQKKLFGIAITYLVLAALFVSYAYTVISKKGRFSLGAAEICFLLFELLGILHVLLSYAGVNRLFDADVYYEYSYIPRQAVYLFVLPAAFLFREKMYVRGKEWLLKHYGEFLFWALYIGELVFFREFMLVVVAQLLLGWLAFRAEPGQRWRKWLMYAAVLLTPLPKDGGSTILVLRIIFLALCVIRGKWYRTVLHVMAIGVLAVLIACFFLPFAVDNSGVKDKHTAWRLRMWGNSVTTLQKTDFLGIGFGTSYPTITFAQESRDKGETELRATEKYTGYERAFVTATHNSFISVAQRMGIAGLFLLLLFLGMLYRNLVRHGEPPSKASCFGLFAGVVSIMFNVGLESPGYLFAFVFLIGECVQEGKKLAERSAETGITGGMGRIAE